MNENFISKQQWDKLKPDKFGKHLKKYEHNKQYRGYNGICRRKLIKPKFENDMQKDFLPHIRIFPQKYFKQNLRYCSNLNLTEKQPKIKNNFIFSIDGGKKYGYSNHNQDFYQRKEMKHFEVPKQRFLEGIIINIYVIKTFHQDKQQSIKCSELFNKQSQQENNLEVKMGRKKLIETLLEKRNGLPCKGLGDKPFKFPDYSPNFFKNPNYKSLDQYLLEQRVEQFKTNKKILEGKQNTLRLWKQKVKFFESQDDISSVQALDNWEIDKRQILKEINPNHVDFSQYLETPFEFDYFLKGFKGNDQNQFNIKK